MTKEEAWKQYYESNPSLFDGGLDENDLAKIQQTFYDGYHECQKEHEWHYVKDGYLPKDENYVLVSNGKDWAKGFYKDKKWYVISFVVFLKIIMWKEIILPELPKED